MKGTENRRLSLIALGLSVLPYITVAIGLLVVYSSIGKGRSITGSLDPAIAVILLSLPAALIFSLIGWKREGRNRLICAAITLTAFFVGAGILLLCLCGGLPRFPFSDYGFYEKATVSNENHSCMPEIVDGNSYVFKIGRGAAYPWAYDADYYEAMLLTLPPDVVLKEGSRFKLFEWSLVGISGGGFVGGYWEVIPGAGACAEITISKVRGSLVVARVNGKVPLKYVQRALTPDAKAYRRVDTQEQKLWECSGVYTFRKCRL